MLLGERGKAWPWRHSPLLKACRCITLFSQRRFKVSFVRVKFKEATRRITGNNWINEGERIMKPHVGSDMTFMFWIEQGLG